MIYIGDYDFVDIEDCAASLPVMNIILKSNISPMDVINENTRN